MFGAKSLLLLLDYLISMQRRFFRDTTGFLLSFGGILNRVQSMHVNQKQRRNSSIITSYYFLALIQFLSNDFKCSVILKLDTKIINQE